MKTRTVTISKNNIFFDVDAATHIFSKVNDGKDLRRFDALESDTTDSFNRLVVTRFADRRAAELRDRLSRFLSAPESEVTSATASINTGATGYQYSFSVESEFQDELMASIAQDIESYIANGVIGDWYATAGDAMANSYLQTLPVISSRILDNFVKRKFPTRS